ncbi:MAG: T9SS type A sorting domain-containing protein [Candidatus Zixiibacteriota bacterium]|nr:MAG: T9SS type A sorting domain-containing protein [candidate division Zixibacteria bacterium]
MKFARNLVASVLMVAVLCVPLFASEQSPKSDAIYRLNTEYPGLRMYSENGQISRIYGKQFGHGSSPEATAEQFRQNHVGVYGVKSEDLRPVSLLFDGRHTQPVMYNRDTGDYKFTLVYYTQYSGDIPVFRSDLRLLILNGANYPLVLAASSLKDLGEFIMPMGVSVNENLAYGAARSFNAGLVNVSEPKLVVWAGYSDEVADQPGVAMEIIADNGLYATEEYQKWLLLVDARTGEILYSEDMILNVDVIGNVSGMATEGPKADVCSTEVSTPMPYSLVQIQNGNSAFADENGDFVISHPDTNDVIVTSQVRGQWFRVFNQTGQNLQLVDTLTPPGPANFLHNENNLIEYDRAQINGYVQANVVRDFTINYNPAYPGLQQNEFPVNVNWNDNCNAYYDYSSINFYTSGGGCANTAFSTVIHHEYGHHLVAEAGSGQGQYGEGQSDVMGVLITNDPNLAYGFNLNCYQGIRTADNNLQYPCTGQIHYCGQLLSGCVWDAREALEITYPNTYMDIIGNLAVNAILLHTGDMITPQITIDYLTLDDDDGNIYNGTPHYDELCTGFNAHSMDCPELHLIEFIYPNGHPDFIDPAGGTIIDVEVVFSIQNPQPGTGRLHYNDGPGWVAIDMQVVSPNVYQAVFPAVTCGVEVLYYFSAQTDQGETVTDPSDSTLSPYALYSAVGFTTLMEDDFEDDLGWTVENSPGLEDGPWERAIPIDTSICDRGNPPSDYDGSGNCYVTDNSSANQCNSDVDNGYTYLISPTMDLTGEDALITYALWYTNHRGDNPHDDYFRTYVSSDNGVSWIEAEEIGPITRDGWEEHKFRLNSFIDPNDQVKIRFEVSDLVGEGSIVEAGIDAFKVERIECGPTSVPDEIDIADLPGEFALLGAYPNPFNARVMIKYALPEASHVTLEIFDLLGRKIETVVDELQPAGYQDVIWDAKDRPTGMYFYKIKMNEFTDTEKMTLLK